MNRKILTFSIDPGEAGTRLDRCLSRLIPGSSRSHLQKLIREGLVFAEGERLDIPRYPVRANMRIAVLEGACRAGSVSGTGPPGETGDISI